MWDWIIRHAQGVMRGAMGAADALVPAVPPEVSGLCASIGSATGWLAPVAGWVPWGALGVALGLWLTGLTAAVAIKLVRIGASFVTLGGGSAA